MLQISQLFVNHFFHLKNAKYKLKKKDISFIIINSGNRFLRGKVMAIAKRVIHAEDNGTQIAVDFAIITTTEIERLAVCKAFGIRDKNRIQKGNRIYWHGYLPLYNGEIYKIVITQSPAIANIDANILTKNIIRDWNPSAILMVGTAWTANNKLDLGDILLTQKVHYYYPTTPDTQKKAIEPVIYNWHNTLWSNGINLPKSAVPSYKRPNGKKNRPKIRGGVLIVGDKSIIDKIVREQNDNWHQKIIAIEEKDYGLKEDFWGNFNSYPGLVIRAICNHIDCHVTGDWQVYAARVAAGFTKNFLAHRPLSPKTPLGKDKSVDQVSGAVNPGSIRVKNKNDPPGKGGQWKWDVFISYSRQDEAIASKIEEHLKNSGLRVWRDKDRIKPGDLFLKKLETGLEQTAAVVVLVSKSSMKSGWVEEEYSRAISISKEDRKSLRIIPVLIEGITSPPGFLANRSWVDLNDRQKFTQNIDSLIEGIKSGLIPTQSPPKRTDSEQKYLFQLCFFSLFPEGINKWIYNLLILKLDAQPASKWALRSGIIESKVIHGTQTIVLKPEIISEMHSYFQQRKAQSNFTDDLLAILDDFVEEQKIFESSYGLGKGRAILLRDLVSLIEHSGETEINAARRERIIKMARKNINNIIQEGYYRVGFEICKALSNITYSRGMLEDLTDARLNLRLGNALKAAQTFDTYKGDHLFADLGLTDLERITFALEWAKAMKDAGNARENHKEIIKDYNQILSMIDGLISATSQNTDRFYLKELKADVLNNRGTQIACYGDRKEWSEVETDINEAAKIFKELEDEQRFLACRANLMGLTIDHLGPQAPYPELLCSFEELEKLASKKKPSEELFFFYYQKGRLLKRLPMNQSKAIESYEQAQGIAEICNLSHRVTIARRWVLHLKKKNDEIGEKDYLNEISKCIDELKQHNEDRWAANTLYVILLEVEKIYRNQGKLDKAFQTLVEAFHEVTRRFMVSYSGEIHSEFRRKFCSILTTMDKLDIDDSFRNVFVNNNRRILTRIFDIPQWSSINWKEIKTKIK
jgi:nucleoside phosphorylase